MREGATAVETGTLDGSKVLTIVGKAMVASLFWYSAIFDMAAHWPAAAEFVAARGLPAPRVLASAAMLFEIIAPAAFLVPRFERLAALSLAAYCLLTAALFHNFWSLPAADRGDADFHFFKNVALAGSLLLLERARRKQSGAITSPP
jgi:putative oxidoreductase